MGTSSLPLFIVLFGDKGNDKRLIVKLVLRISTDTAAPIGTEQATPPLLTPIDNLRGKQAVSLTQFPDSSFSANAYFWKTPPSSEQKLNPINKRPLQCLFVLYLLTSNTSFSRAKQYCLSFQTQVFDSWNNIVWPMKQYCFVRRCKEKRTAKKNSSHLRSRRSADASFLELLFCTVYSPLLWQYTFQSTTNSSKTTSDNPIFKQSVFCKSLEKAFFTHKLAVGCNEGHSQAIRLTFWHFVISSIDRRKPKGIQSLQASKTTCRPSSKIYS